MCRSARSGNGNATASIPIASGIPTRNTECIADASASAFGAAAPAVYARTPCSSRLGSIACAAAPRRWVQLRRDATGEQGAQAGHREAPPIVRKNCSAAVVIADLGGATAFWAATM